MTLGATKEIYQRAQDMPLAYYPHPPQIHTDSNSNSFQ